MTRYKNIQGQRFGMLVANKYVSTDAHNNALWECTCDCGNTTIVRGSSLRMGRTKSCGCLHKPDLTGERFGRLVALEETGTNDRRNVLWKCICDCGNIVEVPSSALRGGHTKSCGCLMRETARKTMTTHGKTHTRLYVVWKGIKARCRNPKNDAYKNYGGRGINLCDEWNDFEVFEEWAYANGYDDTAKHGQCTIDRIDNNGNYEPSNCRWVDMKVQSNNQRPRKKGYKRGKYKPRKQAVALE